MYQRAKKVDGGDYKVGDVVQIPLADVDTTKVDSKCITAVVVEVSEHDSYRVACKQGVMKSLYPYHRLLRVSGVSNDRGVHGLEEIYESWRGTTALSEREAARMDSCVGGQGMVKCGCKGTCDTNRCKCKVANQFCGSRCHKGNSDCENCDRSSLFLPKRKC